MAYFVDLETHTDERGKLTVIEREVPFQIKRVFYIYGVTDSMRGGHRHAKTIQAAICLRGSCIITSNDGIKRMDFNLDTPSKCLILEPIDWHQMHHFTSDAILLVLASEYYHSDDYIYEEYK